MSMHWEDGFYCTYCGKEFGDQPDKLALHIRDIHEKSRGKQKKICNYCLFSKLKKKPFLSLNRHLDSLTV